MGGTIRTCDWSTNPHPYSTSTQASSFSLHLGRHGHPHSSWYHLDRPHSGVPFALWSFLANIGVKIFALIVVFGLALIVIFMAVLYRNALRLQGIFLDYARRFLAEKVSTFAYIPIFLALTAGLFALFLFQHAGFSSKVHSSNNFFDFSSAGFLGWLNLIEFIWGLQFLRDACKYGSI